MKPSRIPGLVSIAMLSAALAGCAAMVQTEVYTLSDRAPAAASSFRVVLEDGQADDLEAARLASRIDTEMARAGFRRVERTSDADLRVRFEFYDDGAAGAPRPAALATAGTGRTTTASSTSTVAGVPVPLARRSTIYRDYGAFVGGPDPGSDRIERRYRLVLDFIDAAGPSHKVTVSTTSTHGDLRKLAPCLVEAAFRDFPAGDRQTRKLKVAAAECQTD